MYKLSYDCDCEGGCPMCEVHFCLDVKNTTDQPLDVTHFDLKMMNKSKRRYNNFFKIIFEIFPFLLVAVMIIK